MISLDSVRERLGIGQPWAESGGVHWLNPGSLSVRDVAAAMHACNARFVTITAYELNGAEGMRLEYHWDLDGALLGIPFQIVDKTVDSIFDLCEAVDWIEREIHEEYSVDFAGREYEPLLLRDGDATGVNLREEAAK